ncbi:MAG: hypothetical protein KDC38_07675 [Planctomycetes bacterium]|nr:hypothetical protein [Planctomycetota bacterium]
MVSRRAWIVLLGLVSWTATDADAQALLFRRGYCNADTNLDLGDVITMLNYLFVSASAPPCLDACDANDDGQIDIGDPVTALNYLFAGGAPLPPPFAAPGADPTPDLLGCGQVASLEVPAISRPEGFGTDGQLGPTLTFGAATILELGATGLWCRFGGDACAGPEGDVGTECCDGPLPCEWYNALGGEWVGGPSAGDRFVVGATASVTVPAGATGLRFFFNDDLQAYDDNSGSVTVTVAY